MTEAGPHLVVGRFRRPHGLKGEVAVFPLTDSADQVFVAGRELSVVNIEGQVTGGPLTISRSRPYHREWLLQFTGIDSRDALEPWRGQFLGVPAATLPPPQDDEVYLHELEGFAVRDQAGSPLGLITRVYEMPSGIMIEVQGPRREFMLPYRKEFVVEVDREGRRITVAPPEGLIE